MASGKAGGPRTRPVPPPGKAGPRRFHPGGGPFGPGRGGGAGEAVKRMLDWFVLQGRRARVTGAAGGLGGAIWEALATQERQPAVDFTNEVAVAFVVPDDACPPTFEGFDVTDDPERPVWTPRPVRTPNPLPLPPVP